MDFEIKINRSEEGERLMARMARRIAEAEQAQGVKINFDKLFTYGKTEKGEDSITDQDGNTIILPPLSPEEQAEDDRDYEIMTARVAAREREKSNQSGG